MNVKYTTFIIPVNKWFPVCCLTAVFSYSTAPVAGELSKPCKSVFCLPHFKNLFPE